MKRTIPALAAALGVLVSMLVTVGLATAPSAQASCPPPDGSPTAIYKFRNKATHYYPTNVHSDWTKFPYGGTINYTTTKTAETDASATVTVEAEAGVIFAKASTSLGITVGKSWSSSQQWSYTANVPATNKYRFRVHLKHFTVSFDVMRLNWSYRTCGYVRAWGSWQHVSHAPAKANNNIWVVDRRAL